MKYLTKSYASGAMALALTATFVVGCSGGEAAAADTDPDKVDPCKLITQAEAQSALGQPVRPGEFVDGVYRICAFKSANGGDYYLNVALFSIDKATFDKADPRQFEPAAGSNLDAFFVKNNDDLNVWHAGNQIQIQIRFGAKADDARVRAAELKLATIAVTRF